MEHELLAQAVIIRAIKDLGVSVDGTQPATPNPADIDSAKCFLLQDDGAFPFWCHIAGYDPHILRDRLSRYLQTL